MKYLLSVLYITILFSIVWLSGNWYLISVAFWISGWLVTYVFLIDPYLKLAGISDLNEAPESHQNFANFVFVRCSYRWPIFWYLIIKRRFR